MKFFDGQHAVFPVSSQNIVGGHTLITVKDTTLETVRNFRSLLVAVSTFHLSLLAFFDGKNIDQAIQIKAGWKIS